MPTDVTKDFWVKYNKCKICGRYFQHKFQLELHHNKCHADEMTDKTADKTNNCVKSCPAILAMQKPNENQAIPIKCEQCPSSFRLYCNFVKHMHAAHGSEILYNCAECDEIFVDQLQLDLHLPTHKVGQQQYKITFNCTKCNAKFYESALLDDHFYRQHVAPYSDSFSCELCDHVFNNAAKFEAHLQQHKQQLQSLEKNSQSKAKNDKRAYSNCQLCGLKMLHKNLSSHMQLHKQSQALYKCKCCTKQFKTAEELDSHHIKEHNNQLHTQEKLYKCEICPQTYVYI